jgi:predicted HicB family RNase H-like nuclease
VAVKTSNPQMVRENIEKVVGRKPEEGTRYTAFRCPEDLLELAKIKARKDRRSLSNYIIMLIAKDVEENSLE